MKLARFRDGAEDSWGVVDGETVTSLVTPFEAWADDAARGALSPEHLDGGGSRSLSEVHLLAPLAVAPKVVCVGLNYRSHVEAFGRIMPNNLVAFLKAPTAIIGPYDDIVHPRLTAELDFELELVVVIASSSGRPGTPDRRYSILGYAVGNDISARDLQRSGERGPDLYSGKSLDDTSPLGPWIVTADELGDQPDLVMTLRVNDEVRQHDRTSSMHWGVPEVLAYVDARTRLLPGDVVYTGTPAGVGLEDKRFLQPGDVVTSEITGIGKLVNTVRSPDS